MLILHRDLQGTAGVEQLRSALTQLAQRLPQASPGTAPSGDPGLVTDQMISALIYLVNRIDLPSEVRLALTGVQAISFLSATAKSVLRTTISRLSAQIALVVSAYNAKLALLPGGVPPRFPTGSIATKIGGQWAVAVPAGGIRGSTSVIKGGHLGESVITLEGCSYCDDGLGVGAFIHQGLFPDPGNAAVVVGSDYASKTGWKPWYKRGWAIGLMVGGGLLVLGGGAWLIFKKRRQ